MFARSHLHQNRLTSLHFTLKFQRKTFADGLIKRTSSILDELESKTLHKDEGGDRWRKKK